MVSVVGKKQLSELGRQNFRNPYAEIIVENQNFTAGDEAVVDNYINRVPREFVERNDGAVSQLQHLINKEFRTSQFNADVQFNIVKRA